MDTENVQLYFQEIYERKKSSELFQEEKRSQGERELANPKERRNN